MDHIFDVDQVFEKRSVINHPRLPDCSDIVYVVEKLEGVIPFGQPGVNMMFPADGQYYKHLLSTLDRGVQGRRCIPDWVRERSEFIEWWARLVLAVERLTKMLPSDHHLAVDLRWLIA